MVMFRAAMLAAICGAVAGVIADLSWPLARYMDDRARCAVSWVVLLMLVSISYCVGVWRGLGQ